MRITCPNCAAEYEVDAGMIPDAGRDVQCSACGHIWMQFSDGTAEEITPAQAAPGPAATETAEPAPKADPAEASAPGARRQMDDETRRILKEEAEREAAARKARRRTADAAAALETQGDLGLDDAEARRPQDVTDVKEAPSPEPELETDSEIDPNPEPVTPDPAQPVEPVTPDDPPVRSRSDRLPDIEEINSTLAARPQDGTDEPRNEDAAGHDPTHGTQDSGFRRGFTLMLLVALILIALYLLAPQIAEAVPGLSPAMTAYVTAADALRTAVNDALQSAADAISGSANGSEPGN